jgi:branched-chain amino acid aminotransferase
METLTGIKVIKTKHSSLPGIDFDRLGFGKQVSDHMLVADFYQGEWNEVKVVPFANLSLSPATLALHYGQTVFEGMKAFQMQDGRVNIFRIQKHFERFNRSLRRMCMAEIPEEIFEGGMKQLIAVDKNWVPGEKQGSLYIRPFMFASETRFGIAAANEYRFVIFTGPVAQLFSKPIRVKIEREYIRAARGGTGFAKCGGNYGGALYPAQLAKAKGYENVIWTDAKEHKYIEESGMMNLLFVIDGTLITPPTSDSILDGVTRDSLLTIAKDMGIRVEIRPVAVDEIVSAFKQKNITEVFGAGTAAVVAPIDNIGIDGTDYKTPPYTDDSIMFRLKRKLTAIRCGKEKDIYNWNTIVR